MLRLSTVAAIVALVCVGAAGASAGSAALPPLPARWPHTLQLGLTDSPGGAAALRKAAPFGFRYQYLAGGVNTGQGWSTWNPNGSFASMYVQDSWAARGDPGPHATTCCCSRSPAAATRRTPTSRNLRNAATMTAYWRDVRLLFARVQGPKTVVVHVEPDLWGYLEQAKRRRARVEPSRRSGCRCATSSRRTSSSPTT